jgi:hypothetical protein
MNRHFSITDALPLSHCQQGYLADTGGDPADPMHNTALPLLFERPIAADRLRDALRRLMQMHPMLRTAVRLDAGGDSQHLLPEPAHWWQQVDASALDRQALLQQAADDLRRPFVLERGLFRATLFRGSEAGDLLLLALHHLATDAASWGIIGRDLLACCAAEQAPASRPQETPAPTYADYLHWEQALLASDQGRRMEAYWRGRLADPGPVLALADQANQANQARQPPGRQRNGRVLGIALSPEQVDSLHRCAAALKSSRFAVLLAAYLLLLHRRSGQADIGIMVPCSMARQQPRFAGLVGLLVSPLVIRLRFASPTEPTFAALVRDINLQLLQGLYHQPYPTTALLERLPGTDGSTPGRRPRAMAAWERSDFIPRHFAAGGLHAERCDIPQLQGLFDLGLTFLEDPAGSAIFGALSHDSDRIGEAAATAIADEFFVILEQGLAQPDHCVPQHSGDSCSAVEVPGSLV